jgi:hypothetical protein
MLPETINLLELIFIHLKDLNQCNYRYESAYSSGPRHGRDVGMNVLKSREDCLKPGHCNVNARTSFPLSSLFETPDLGSPLGNK